MQTNHEGEIFIEVYIVDFMDLKLPFNDSSKTINKNTHTHTKITKKRNIPVIIWMVVLIKHSTINNN